MPSDSGKGRVVISKGEGTNVRQRMVVVGAGVLFLAAVGACGRQVMPEGWEKRSRSSSSTEKVSLPVREVKPIGPSRMWRTAEGVCSVEAELLEFRNGVVWLKTKRGDIGLPLEKFCDADQQYVRQTVGRQPAPNSP